MSVKILSTWQRTAHTWLTDNTYL